MPCLSALVAAMHFSDFPENASQNAHEPPSNGCNGVKSEEAGCSKEEQQRREGLARCAGEIALVLMERVKISWSIRFHAKDL